MKDYDQSLSVLVLTTSLPGGHPRNRVLNTMVSLYTLNVTARKRRTWKRGRFPRTMIKKRWIYFIRRNCKNRKRRTIDYTMVHRFCLNP